MEKLIYRFRDFELEPGERRLMGAGKPIALTPKVFDTLVLLVERAGHVVSKDELMKHLWPRGYVDESNLTKHIWLIRRALGEAEQDFRFIETVPKIGYRFIASVTTAEPAACETPDVGEPSVGEFPAAGVSDELPDLAMGPVAAAAPATSGAVAPKTRRYWPAGMGIAVLLIVAGWQLISRQRVATETGRPGQAIAFVGFSNLSRNAKDAWIAPALTEMLGSELNVAGDYHVVPDELVRDASVDVAPPAAGGYAPQTLARLRQRLDADYVISGSYLVSGDSDDAPLRVDVALQDARNGAVLASVSNQSALGQVTTLVASVGVKLRDKLGIVSPGVQALGLIANEQPPNVDVARRVGFALEALRHYDPARARDELIEAIAQAPGYAPAYTYLAQAWSALGYHDKALAAAGQAAQRATNLPDEERQLTDAVLDSERSDWLKAADVWHTLATLKPLNPEYRLHQIDAQLAAGKATDAGVTLADLRRLPEVAEDARIELAGARIASALDDARGDADHATKALRLAQQHDAAGLIADARLELAAAQTRLGQRDMALVNLGDAIDGYRSIRNPRGEAAARRARAAILADLDRGQEAREEYQRALALDQSVGDVAGVARVYRDLCEMLWVSGDRDGAQSAARHSLELSRETGDLHLQAWTLRALATIAADEAVSDEVMDEYREVTALTERSGDRGGHVWSLATYADAERMRGKLDQAQATCEQSKAEAKTLSDPQFAVYSGFTCALVSVDRGDTAAAAAALQAALRHAQSVGNVIYVNDAQMMLAQLDMDQGQWAAARDKLHAASRGFAAAELRTGEADTQALLALCAQALGDTAERDAAVDRARTLRQAMTSRQEVYVVDIALAQIGPRADAASVEKLLALAADAERRQFVPWALEARLAAWRLMQMRGTQRALREEIEKSARSHGFGRILKLVQQPVPVSG